PPEPPDETVAAHDDERDLGALVARTLVGLERTTTGPVLASQLKRALLRKDPTFNETTYGFRGFGELLRHLEAEHIVELSSGSAAGDPEVRLRAKPDDEQEAFAALPGAVERLG